MSGYCGMARFLKGETVCEDAEEKCRDQRRCGESNHSDGIHTGFPWVEIIAYGRVIYSLPGVRWLKPQM